MRLLVALVTAVSMLHLSLVGSGGACSSEQPAGARNGMAPMATSVAQHEVSALHAHAAPTDAPERHRGDDAPTQQRCCESMSSCGVTTMTDVAETGSSARSAASGAPADSDTMLASVATAPEPPPPKA